MNHVAAHGTITLSTTLARGSVEVDQVEFEILDGNSTVIDRSGPVPLANRRATWNWTPNHDGQKALPDDRDTVVVHPRVTYSFEGTSIHRGLDDVTVFRDRVNLKVVTEQGEIVKNARVRLVVHRRGIFTKQTLGSVLSNAAGISEFTGILQWTRLEPTVKAPWEFADDAAPYSVGKDVGLDREIKVAPKKYLAAFKGIKVQDTDDFEDIAELGGSRRQFVNFDHFDASKDTLLAGESKSYFGHTVQIKVAPAENPDEFEGDYIYVKLIADPGNGPRNSPRPRLVGADQDGIARLTLGADGAVATVCLGFTGGDKFKLQVCSAKKFSTTPDEEFEIVNWRRVYYEIMAPAAMTAGLAPAVLPIGSGVGPHYDIPDGTRQHMLTILDPLFIDYKLARTLVFPNTDVKHASQLVPAAFFERTDGRDLYIGSFFTKQPNNIAFTIGKDRTIYMTVFDVYFGTSTSPVVQNVQLEATQLEFAPSGDRAYFLPDPKAITPYADGLVEGVSYMGIQWEAVIDPSKYTSSSHPGIDGGKPRKGTLDAACFRALTWKRLQLTLPALAPTDPGSFVGPESSATCPIKVSFKINEVGLSGGGDLSGSQVIYLHPRDDITGTILCHELSHAIGMTPIRKTTMYCPPGLPEPKHVDEGGNYYRHPVAGDTAGQNGVRDHGQGPHCAHGLPDMTIQDYPLKIPDNGCVMYAYVPSPRFPYSGNPHLFCDTCKTLLKAMDMRDLH